MKKQHAICLLLCITIIIFSGCRNITVTTKVNANGSFTRIIKITGDSASVFEPDLPYPIDDSWKKTVIKDTTDQGDYILTYTKTYKKSDQLQSEISQDTSWRKGLGRNITIDKSFGFFYSHLTFRETYKATMPFEKLGFPNYLTPEEMFYITGAKKPISPGDSIKYKEASDKYIGFLVEGITNQIIATMEVGIEKLNDPQLKPETVALYRDSLEHRFHDYDGNMDIYIDFYKAWTGNESFEKLKTLEPPLFGELNKKVFFALNAAFMDSYTQAVEMPGLITETNAKSVTGNKVSWRVTCEHFLFEDYEMKVESRVVNRWVFIVSGVFLLLVLVMLFLKVRG